MKKKLGRIGIEVSAMGMGCWAIGGPFWRGKFAVGWGEVDDEESIRAINTCIDLGVNFFDTANVYGAGHSEHVLGRAVKNLRDKVIIATKFGNTFNEDTKQITGSDVSPVGIRKACEDSLRRLNTDYIDLYQFHIGGHPVSEAGEVRETLEELVRDGKIRAYGWSTDLPDRASFFAEGPNCSSIQLQLNVLEDNPEVIAVCEEYDLAAINRGPLAMGLLTGKYTSATQLGEDDVRGTKAPDWMKYFNNGRPTSVWLNKVNAVRDVLTSEGRTLAQGAVAWLWARSEKTIPIPGIRTFSQAEENCKAMEYGSLTPDQMTEIRQILSQEE